VSSFKTNKRFGQHFLVDQQVLFGICNYAQLDVSKFCIEIGPGQGALTKYLLETEAKLHAIEIDKRLTPTLDKFASQYRQFSYTLADVLSIDFSSLIKVPKATVVGNLPYEISTPLLFKLIEDRDKITQMVFLLQKEVVDRIVAPVGTKAYGRLSVMMQYYFEVSGLMVVPPEAFSPPPKVVSQVVRLRPVERVWVDHDELSLFVKFLFAQQRKMLRQRFKPYLFLEEWNALKIDPTQRPSDLSLDTILTIFNYLQEKGVSI